MEELNFDETQASRTRNDMTPERPAVAKGSKQRYGQTRWRDIERKLEEKRLERELKRYDWEEYV